MKIQLLCSGKKEVFRDRTIKISKLSEPYSFDSFDINIIDLNDRYLWKSENYSSLINSIDEFVMLSSNIKTANKNVIIILPQNLIHEYNKDALGGYYNNIELKNCINEHVIQKNLKTLYGNIELQFIYNKNETKINGKSIISDFTIEKQNGMNVLTESECGKITTVSINNNRLIFTVLNLEDKESFMEFIKNLFPSKKVEIPSWAENYNFYTDEEEKESIIENKKEITEIKQKISESEENLKENNYYKSILYSKNQELADVVVKILNQILDGTCEEFVDKGKEDYLLKIGGITYLFEIKGTDKSIKKAFVSQLQAHVHEYIDKLEEEGKTEETKGFLIINDQSSLDPAERGKVPIAQIELAESYKFLIIRTETLLKIYEKFLNNDIKVSEIIDIFKTRKGILEIE